MNTIRELMKKINIRENEPMRPHTTFQTGGPARLYAEPSGGAELMELTNAARADGIPVFILGGGANLLVADAGIDGLVISTCRLRTAEIHRTENGIFLRAGAGLPVSDAAASAAEDGLAGLESFYAMPGSVGGAVWMNARCYGESVSGVLESVTFWKPGAPAARTHNRADSAFMAEFSYKNSPFQPRGLFAGAVILHAVFRLTPGNTNELWKRMREIENDRRAKGHFTAPCAGSVFKNNRAFGEPTGKILDRLGLRGFSAGGARVSPLHANIIINTGTATSADIRRLIETLQNRAAAELGFQLEPEIIYAGEW